MNKIQKRESRGLERDSGSLLFFIYCFCFFLVVRMDDDNKILLQ